MEKTLIKKPVLLLWRNKVSPEALYSTVLFLYSAFSGFNLFSHIAILQEEVSQ